MKKNEIKGFNFEIGEFNAYLMTELGFELVNYVYEKKCDNGVALRVECKSADEEILYVDNGIDLHFKISLTNIGLKSGDYTKFEELLSSLGINCWQKSTQLNDTILRKYGFEEFESKKVDIVSFDDDFFKYGYSVNVLAYSLTKNGITFMYKCKDIDKPVLQAVSEDFKYEFEGIVRSEERLRDVLNMFGCLDKAE